MHTEETEIVTGANPVLVWLRQNALAGCIVAALILQWGQFQQTAKLAERTADQLQKHEQNREIHVDPTRDERRWDDLIRRLDRLESKIDFVRDSK